MEKKPANAAPRRCAKPDCNQLQPCSEHPPGWRATKVPLPPNWPTLRSRCRAAYDGRCAKCGAQAWSTGSCDHIIPRSRGGTDHQSNLQWLCRKCHNYKTYREDKKKK